MRNLTTSLELSRKLKEAGVPQVSTFYWEIHESLDRKKDSAAQIVTKTYPKSVSYAMNTYSAFLAEEIGRWLPIKVVTQKSIDEQSKWMGFYKDSDEIWYADTVADLWGKMLLYLLRQGIISKDDLK